MVTTQKGEKEQQVQPMQLRALRMYCSTTINNCTVKCNSFSLNNILKSTYNHYPHFMDFYFFTEMGVGI